MAYNKKRILMLRGLIGKALRCDGQLEEAQIFLLDAQNQAFRMEDDYLIGFVLQQNFHSALMQGDFKFEDKQFEEAIDLLEIAVKASELHVKVLREAIAERSSIEKQEILTKLQGSLVYALVNKSSALITYEAYSKRAFEQSKYMVDYSNIFGLLREAIDLAQKFHLHRHKGYAYFVFADALNDAGQYNDAQDYIFQAYKIFKEIGHSTLIKRVESFSILNNYQLEKTPSSIVVNNIKFQSSRSTQRI